VVSATDPAALGPCIEAEQLRALGPHALLGHASLVLEIGFGRAELLMDLAEAAPGRAFLGVEISRKRVVKAARRVQRRGLTNCFLLHAPAQYALERVLPPGCAVECWINCPDPWPKKRHFKRRLIQPAFVALLVRVLAPGARLHIATDHPGYAEWIAQVLSEAPGLENLHAPAPFSSRAPPRRLTAYEQEWLAEGRAMAYFDYRRQD
jgi:tRNA (guanine-N7-)-methyltransferase